MSTEKRVEGSGTIKEGRVTLFFRLGGVVMALNVDPDCDSEDFDYLVENAESLANQLLGSLLHEEAGAEAERAEESQT